ncbi:Aste57867_12123 [Aphanomyces stellatus]|uniref:Aste57867_12123 protein n=1 Tax=Aphanomyces stellatus TaxID=120398 RepID=A0A485KV62_9STRA|nr:hypothetical protein As57867_012078 [Aphanomyces stellatus]VFT88977.1 Aste57867_12123 [Aphanomyces stellatus]
MHFSDMSERGRVFLRANGSTSRVPEGWVFPIYQVRTMWAYWYRGDAVHRIGPYRTLSRQDVLETSRARLSQAKAVMRYLETIAMRRGLVTSPETISTMALADCMAIVDRVYEIIAVDGPPIGSASLSISTASTNISQVKQAAHATGHLPYTWPDGSRNHVPDGWAFPHLTCREMYVRWYRGDNAGIGPFRDIPNSRIPVYASRQHQQFAKKVSEEITRIALLHGLVPSLDALTALPPPQLLDVFDQAYSIFLYANPKGTVVGPGAGRLAPREVHTCLAGKVYRIIMQLDDTSSPTGVAAPVDMLTSDDDVLFVWADRSKRKAPETWSFPHDVPCSQLWFTWFHGDIESGVGPLHTLQSSDVKGMVNINALVRAQTFMGHLVDLAICKAFAVSAHALRSLGLDASRAVFAKTYDALFHDNPLCLLAGNGPHQLDEADPDTYTWQTVSQALVQRIEHERKTAKEESEAMRQKQRALAFRARQHQKKDVAARRVHDTTWFAWPDGLQKRAPPGWTFPAKVSVAALWRFWFDGESTSEMDNTVAVGPYRFLQPTDVEGAENVLLLDRALALMRDLISLAVNMGWTRSAAAIAALNDSDDVLDMTLDALLEASNITASADESLDEWRVVINSLAWIAVRDKLESLEVRALSHPSVVGDLMSP